MNKNPDPWCLVDVILEKILIFIVLAGAISVLGYTIFDLIFNGRNISEVWEGLKFLPKYYVTMFNGLFIVFGWFKVFLWVMEKTGIGGSDEQT